MVKKIKFILRYLGLLIKYCSLLITYWIIPKRNILLIPQNGLIGGTAYFTKQLFDLLSKTNEVAFLVPENELAEYKYAYKHTEILFLSYKDELDHIEHYYSKQHSLYKYFRLDILRQQSFILKNINLFRVKKILISATHPGRFSSILLAPCEVLYFLHTLPWIDLDPGNKQIIKKALKANNKKIITVSEYAKREILNYWDLAQMRERVNVIYNFYEPKYSEVSKPDKGYLQILTLGNMLKDKNPEIWLQVAIELTRIYGSDNLSFVWAGKGELLDKYRQESSIYENINFVGWVDDVDRLYIESDIYLQPSYAESHGIAVLGAMAHGLPCVATNKGGTTESIINEETGFLCNTRSKSEIIAALERLIRSKELIASMGKKGSSRYDQLFTKGKWVKKIHAHI